MRSGSAAVGMSWYRDGTYEAKRNMVTVALWPLTRDRAVAARVGGTW